MKELRQKTLKKTGITVHSHATLKQVITIKINAYFCLRVGLRNHDELEPSLKAKDKRVSNNILMCLLNQYLFLIIFQCQRLSQNWNTKIFGSLFFFFNFGEIVHVPVISFLMVSELFVIISNRRYDSSTLLNGIRFCLCGSKLF